MQEHSTMPKINFWGRKRKKITKKARKLPKNSPKNLIFGGIKCQKQFLGHFWGVFGAFLGKYFEKGEIKNETKEFQRCEMCEKEA